MKNWNGNIAKIALPTNFAVGDVNVYVIKGEALTLIDSGAKLRESEAALDEGLKQLGLRRGDIEQIILTHHHPDHSGGLDFFDRDVPVFGHKNNQRWLKLSEEFLESHDRFFLEFAEKLGVEDELKDKLIHNQNNMESLSRREMAGFVAEGDELPGLPGWRAIETLGHAQSHLSFYREKDGVMIAGDHLLAKISPNPLMEPPLIKGGERERPMLQYNTSLQKIAGLPLSLIYTGHGGEIAGDEVEDLIRHRMERQHGRAMQIKGMLMERALTPFEICRQLFPKVYRQQVDLTLSETVGQLDYLESLGEIITEMHSGVIFHSAASPVTKGVTS